MESHPRFTMSGNAGSENVSIDEYAWSPHSTSAYWAITQTIESVEEQVERLLDEDALATEVKYGLFEACFYAP